MVRRSGGTVTEVDGLLYESLAEGTASYNGSAVIVLNGARKDSLAEAELSFTNTTSGSFWQLPVPLAYSSMRGYLRPWVYTINFPSGRIRSPCVWRLPCILRYCRAGR